MTKKQTKTTIEEQDRQSRKQVLLARKERQQKRSIYTGIAIVGGLLLVLFLVGIINELFISPKRPVAEVSGQEITLSDWQDRVRFDRAQRILLLESQLEAFGDVGLIQQFYGQLINELVQPELMGQTVMNSMTEDVVVVQAAADRGITVTDEEIDAAIGESFNYFGGELPTPLPTPTETIMPTPSLTPIPTAVITELLPTNTPFPTVTAGPTLTPLPTATPVSQTAFQEELSNLLADYQELGITEAQYREFVRLQLYRERLTDALAEERNLSAEAEHASFFFMAFEDETSANEALASVEQNGFLPTWNEVRSQPPDPEATSIPIAQELLWRTQSDVEQSFGEEVAQAAFALPIEEASGVLVQTVDEETSRYFITMVSGREVRPLSQAAIDQAKQQELSNYLDGLLTGNLTFTEYEKGRVPETPRLDPIFYTPVTPTPGALGTAAPESPDQ